MRRLRRRNTDGQSIIIIALSLSALLGFVGLAIDGSHVYIERRRQQNSADAAAYAGARLVALGQSTNQQVLDAVNTYLSANGGDPNVSTVKYITSSAYLGDISSYEPNSNPPSQAVGVYVVARQNFNVFFGGVLGSSQKTAEGESMVGYGSSCSKVMDSGAFPVTVQTAVLDKVHPGDTITVWDSDKVTDAEGNDLGGERGWISFNYIYGADDPNSRTVSKNNSNADLKNWAESGTTTPVTIEAGTMNGDNGDFVNGDPGVRDSAIQAASSRVGQVVSIPVYDRAEDSAYMSSKFTEPSIGWANGAYYHVVAFAKFVLTAAQSTGSNKYIQGHFLSSSSTMTDGCILNSSNAYSSDNAEKSLSLLDNFNSTSTSNSNNNNENANSGNGGEGSGNGGGEGASTGNSSSEGSGSKASGNSSSNGGGSSAGESGSSGGGEGGSTGNNGKGNGKS